MKTKTSLFTTALMAGVCALALTACQSMSTAWNDVTGDDAPYAGNVQPPAQSGMQPPASQQASMQQPVIPASAMQPMQQPQMAAQQMPMQQPMMQQPQQVQAMMQSQPAMYQPQQVVPVANYTPNLASVPARPTPAEMPSAQQVQTARADLNAANRTATGYLRDPGTANGTPMAQMQPPQAPTQSSATPNYTAPAAMMTNADQLMGLQATTPGHYALTPLAPESPLGGFSLASSLMYAPGNDQVSMPQYQELRRVAGQYAAQPGRVRVVSYADANNGQSALQRATTAAAYLVDLGVPANAIRVKVDSAAAPSPAGYSAPSKTDIFLETSQAR